MLEMPACIIHMKGIEAGRAELLAASSWRALDALSELPTATAAAVEALDRVLHGGKGGGGGGEEDDEDDEDNDDSPRPYTAPG